MFRPNAVSKRSVGSMTKMQVNFIIVTTLYFCVSAISLSIAQEPPVEELLVELKSNDPTRIVRAIKQVEEFSIRDQQIVKRLVLLLDDDRRDSAPAGFGQNVQIHASFAMLKQGVDAAPIILEQLVKIKSDRGLCLALESVGIIGVRDLNSYNAVLQYLRHEDESVRSRAISAMSRLAIDEPAFVSNLTALLKDESVLIRATAIACLNDHLTAIGPALENISLLLIDDAEYYEAISNHAFTTRKLRAAVAKLLGKVGLSARPFLPMLQELLLNQEDVKVKVWSAMAICAISEIPPSEVLAKLGDLLVSDLGEEWCNNEAIEAITDLGRKALPIADRVQEATKHKSSLVRLGIAKAFFAIDPESATSKVVLLSFDEDELVAETAIEELSKNNAHGRNVVEAYINALNREDPSLRYSAIEALRKLGPNGTEAIPDLEKLIGEDTEGAQRLKDEARNALKAIRK